MSVAEMVAAPPTVARVAWTGPAPAGWLPRRGPQADAGPPACECGDSGARFFRVGTALVKCATGLPATRLGQQARWFQMVPGSVRQGFPTVLGYRRRAGAAYLVSEYVPWRAMDALICEGGLAAGEGSAALVAVLDWVREHMYVHDRAAPAGVLESVVAQARARQNAIAAAAVPALRGLATNERVVVNGEEMWGAEAALKRLAGHRQALRAVAARRVVLVHGDLHTGNVLYGGPRFLLLDPRGDFPNGDIRFDPAYDGGKLLHDLHGGYALIRRGGAELEETAEGHRFRLLPTPAREAYAELLRTYRAWGDGTLLARDPAWWARALLMEALLLCGVVPFHLRHPRRATLLYLTGIVFLNRWLRWVEAPGPLERLFRPADAGWRAPTPNDD